MRVLHVTDRLSGRGGADWHLLGVIAHQQTDHETHLAVAYADGTVGDPCSVTIVDGLGARTRAAVDLDPVVERVHPDVIHVHNVVNPTVLEWAAERGAVMTVQDHRSFCPARGKLTTAGEVCREPFSAEVCAQCFSDEVYFAEMLELTSARLAAIARMRALTVLSHYMKEELASAGVPPESVTVIPPFVHGLDLELASADGAESVLFVGRVVAAKGVLDAVAAWQQSQVGLPLVVAGTGAERRQVEAAGAKVAGWLSHTELARLYRRARAVLVPSRWQEPFGIVGLEALTAEVPVVAWDSGGIRDWHPGGELLLPWGDVDGLAAALRTAVEQRAAPPPGFEPGPLVARLTEIYAAR